jgi:hypothetical protein
MVWEVECAECGDILEFGGSGEKEIPEDAIEWDGKVYCKSCVKKFVKLGVGDIQSRVDYIEETLDEVTDDLGIEFDFKRE